MPIWIAAILFIAVLVLLLSLLRMRIPRDAEREGDNDYESTMAYDRVSRNLVFQFIRFLMINRMKHYQPQGTLIDAGCGTGYLDLIIAKKYPSLNITGVDLSAQMIELAEKKLSQTNLDHRIAFRKSDVADLPFEDNSVDFVVSTLSLHHWIQPKEALEEIYRVLKPEGQVLIFDLRRDEPLLVYYGGHIIQRLFTPRDIQRVNGAIGSIWSSYTPQEMETLVSKSPFTKWQVQAGWAWTYVWGRKI